MPLPLFLRVQSWQGQVRMLAQLDLAEPVDTVCDNMPWVLSDDGSEAYTPQGPAAAGAVATADLGSILPGTAAAAATWGTCDGDDGSMQKPVLPCARERSTGGGSSISLPTGLMAGMRAGSCSWSSRMSNSRAMQVMQMIVIDFEPLVAMLWHCPGHQLGKDTAHQADCQVVILLIIFLCTS